MKIFKSIMQMLIVGSLLAVTYLWGVYSAKYEQNQEENKSTIMTIAVVNADTGTMVDGEKTFYATELMAYPDTNFESASLMEAKEGVTSGRYAAYILIPENFSTSIVSVNEEPVKSQISYSIHNNLRQDVEIKVVNDIHNFILNLSTNVSYIYVDAILDEMHAVQDDSETIMKNDIEDMESIEAVESADLIEDVEYEPIEVVETEIEYMDLTDDYEALETAVSNIDTTFTTNMETAETEFLLVKEGGVAVSDQVTATETVLTEVDILTDSEGNSVYGTGMENLGNLAEDFDEEADEKKAIAKQRLGFKEGDPEPEPEPELAEGEVRYYVSKDDLMNQVISQINYLESIQGFLPVTLDNRVHSEEGDSGEGDTGNESEGEETEEEEETIKTYDATQEGAEEAIEDLNLLRQRIEEYYLNGIRAINDIPDASALVTDADLIINDEIATPLEEEISAEASNVTTALGTMQETLDTYVTALDEYDAMSYLESEKITEYQDSMYTTITDMEDAIAEQDDAYLAYIDEVVETSDSNLEMLQTTLDTSYEQTQENINTTMSGFKENRAELNELNVTLLDGITQKLPYTRLGTLEYTQVYDFIAQPIVSSEAEGTTTNITTTSVNMDQVDLIKMCIGITALMIIYFWVQIIHRKVSVAKEKGEEDELWQAE
ncbi:MAG: hypothetical protein J6B68_10100 [Lachnospiraceae bacterium]|nr:hypothetical protein [Lachnospiraceae bacterium]